MQDITAWLNSSRDYVSGIALYRQHGSNAFLKTLFQSGPTAYNVKKLADELQGLAGADAHDIDVVSIPKPVTIRPIVPAISSNAVKAQDHSKYLSLLSKRDNTVRQLDRNMAALDFSTDQMVLHETAKQILKLHRTKQEVWALIDFYESNECFEQEAEPETNSREKSMQLIYQSISKAKKRLAEGCKNPEKTKKLIEKKLNELAKLKEQLI